MNHKLQASRRSFCRVNKVHPCNDSPRNFHLMRVIQLFIFLISSSYAVAQTVAGKWKTIDDVTGKPRSIVEIYEKNGAMYGKVLQIFYRKGEKEDPVCEKCDAADTRFNKKIIGMDIINNLKKDGSDWQGGTILDPDNGKIYDCKIWLEDSKLQVRGYILFFFRTQTWLPLE